jgi:hypothetical protein
MRIWSRGWLAALGLGLAAGLAGAQQPGTTVPAAESGSWWSGLFGSRAQPKKDQPSPIVQPPPEQRARDHDREMNAYLRRLAVIDRLREVALETNDSTLTEEANRLNDLAWRVYQQHAAKLLGTAPVHLEAEPVSSAKAHALLEDKPADPAPWRAPPAGVIPRGNR